MERPGMETAVIKRRETALRDDDNDDDDDGYGGRGRISRFVPRQTPVKEEVKVEESVDQVIITGCPSPSAHC